MQPQFNEGDALFQQTSIVSGVWRPTISLGLVAAHGYLEK